jgi:hypothetical protein
MGQSTSVEKETGKVDPFNPDSVPHNVHDASNKQVEKMLTEIHREIHKAYWRNEIICGMVYDWHYVALPLVIKNLDADGFSSCLTYTTLSQSNLLIGLDIEINPNAPYCPCRDCRAKHKACN